MIFKKSFLLLTIVVSCCGYSQIVYACEDKFSYPAYGSLRKEDLDQLKKEYINRSIQINRKNTLHLWNVQSILGFSGQLTKKASNGRIEDWIWVDSENCNRLINASFRDEELIQIKTSGF